MVYFKKGKKNIMQREITITRIIQYKDFFLFHKMWLQAACGLCVGVGSFSDPPEIPGMAHFLEHMVFMGSEKYPQVCTSSVCTII